MPRRFGFGLGFSLSRLSGIPREPSGFVAKYTAYLVSNFTLVTGSNVSQWDDESVNANNLTQATSANQPTFNDDGVSVTQSTLANQPTLVDTGGGVLAVDFKDSNEALNNIPVNNSTEFSVEIDIKEDDTTGDRRLFNSQTQSESIKASGASYYSVRFSDNATVNLFHNSDVTQRNKVKFVTNGTDIKLYMNDVLEDTKSAIGKVLDINAIGTTSFSMRGSVYSVRLWNSSDSSGTPDFELLPDIQYIPSGIGQPVPTWYATQHNQYANTVNFDATDDNMTPLPTTTGDFAMQFKKKANTLATTKVLFSSSTTSAEVRLNTSNQFEVVSDAGTVFTFTTTLVASQQEVNIIQRSGNNLEVYNSIGVKQVIDVTGEAFTFDRISDTANASDSDWQEIRIYDEILDQDSIDYFYYLRNANNEILLPPLLPS